MFWKILRRIEGKKYNHLLPMIIIRMMNVEKINYSDKNDNK